MCQRNEAKGFCRKCEMKCCSDCFEIHKRIPPLKDHIITPLNFGIEEVPHIPISNENENQLARGHILSQNRKKIANFIFLNDLGDLLNCNIYFSTIF